LSVRPPLGSTEISIFNLGGNNRTNNERLSTPAMRTPSMSD
jgi:hypothetical protein